MAIRRTGSQTLVNRGVTAATSTPVNIITGSGGGGATVNISSIQIANSTFVAKDDLAIDTAGGYMIINGTGFQSGAVVYIQGTAATSTSFVSSSRLNVTVPALSSGVLDVYVVNTDGSGSIYLRSLSANGVPSWTTTSPLTSQDSGVAFAINLVASGAAGDGTITYAVSSGSTLPSGTFLASNGYFYGTVTEIQTETTFSFSVDAIDAQNQETARTFNITVTASDTYFNFNTLLINGETSNNTWITDTSTNNFAITVNGDTKPTAFSPYETVWSNYFDGTGDLLTGSATDTSNFGTGQYTIEAWVYFNSLVSYAGIYIADFYFGLDASQRLAVGRQNVGFDLVATVPPLNQWVHLAASRDSSNNTRLFINGSVAASQVVTTSYGSASFSINRSDSSFPGYISNLRIVKGTAVYTAAFTPPTSPLTAIANTSLLTCQSNRLIDNSTNNFTITKNGDVTVSNFGPFVETDVITGSGYFDGSSEYITVPNNVALQIGSSNFCIEGWYYPVGVGVYQGLVAKRATATSIGSYVIYSTINSNALNFYASSNNLSFDIWNGASIGTTVNNTWNHFAVYRIGNNWYGALNGIVSSFGSSAATLYADTNPLSIGGETNGSGGIVNTINGYLSNLRIVKGNSVYGTSNFTPPTSPLTAIANTSLLTLQSRIGENNNRFVDTSGINNIITRNGNTTQGTFSPYSLTGWSGYFTGSATSYIQTATTSVCNQGQTYTVQCWIYPTAFQTSTSATRRMYIFVKGVIYAGLSIHSDGTLGWYGWPTPAGMIVTSAAGTITTNVWQHVALVVNPSSYIKLFKNGVEVATGSYTAAGLDNSAIIIGHGDTGQTTTDGFVGYISNFKVTPAALTSGQLDYSATPTVSSPTNSSLMVLQSNRFVDNGPNALAITVGAALTVQSFSPFSPRTVTPTSYSGYFDGTGDYLTAPYNSAWDFGTGNFTIECWLYPTTAGTLRVISASFTSSGNAGWSFELTTGNLLTFYAQGSYRATSSASVPVNTWTHVAVSRSGSTLKLFVNGVESSSVTYSASIAGLSGLLAISGTQSGGSLFTGYQSNFRIVNSAVYTAAFTPSTSPLTAITNTSLLTCQSSTFIDNSTNNFTITVNGDAAPRKFNPFGDTITSGVEYSVDTVGGSMFFDGTGDYLNWSNSIFTFGTDDFTVEAWVYVTGSADFGIFGVGGASAGSYGLYWINSTSKFQSTRYGDTAGAGTTTNAYAKNQWIHVAAVRIGGTARIYVNGVLDSGATYSMGSVTNSGAYAGAIWNSASAAGYISNLRFMRGKALYTTNFVPPVAPLTPVADTSLLLNGTSGGIIDYTGKNNLETVGNVQLRSNIVKYGNTSMYFDGTGDYLYIPSSINYGYGTGNFTIEFWLYLNSTGLQTILSHLSSNPQVKPHIYYSSGVRFYVNGADVITGGAVTVSTWTHIALSRSGTSTKLFINGTQSGSTYTDSNNYGTSSPLIIADYGVPVTGTNMLNGYIDDLRITNGVARYTANFTTPSKLRTK